MANGFDNAALNHGIKCFIELTPLKTELAVKKTWRKKNPNCRNAHVLAQASACFYRLLPHFHSDMHKLSLPNKLFFLLVSANFFPRFCHFRLNTVVFIKVHKSKGRALSIVYI